jgi:hypothetical protein
LKKITELSRHAILKIITHAYFAVSEAKARLHDEPGWTGREGGYFCLADGRTGFPYAIVLIGSVPEEKSAKYLALCQEKALRLVSNPQHVSSWESRDPENGKWGGAVRVDNLIYSFSGFPELGDEATMLATAAAWRPCTRAEIYQIIARSDNPYWEFFHGFLERYA